MILRVDSAAGKEKRLRRLELQMRRRWWRVRVEVS